jgi:predicted nucleic acid-binding protein
MREREQPVATVSAVLAEVVHGRQQDAAVFNAVRRDRVDVYSVDPQVGVRAGQLMGAARMNSAHAVDAFVVAVADVQGGAIIATVDSDDMGRLAQHASRVEVADIR